MRCSRRDNRATGGHLDPINVGADVPAVEGPVAQGADGSPEVPLERVDEPGVRHPRWTERLARVRRAVGTHDDVALEYRPRRVALERPVSAAGVAAVHAVRTSLKEVAVH